MRLVIIGLSAGLVLACTPPTENTGGALVEGCDARATAPWTAGDTTLNVEAATTGPDCARAVATLVIRDSSGGPIYVEAHQAQHLMTLASAADQPAMQTALGEWIDSAGNTTMQTTSALPEWPANADAPQNGEFPFYPSEGMTREEYGSIRAANAPLYCYVQGMESLSCIAWRDGGLQQIGVQTFPG